MKFFMKAIPNLFPSINLKPATSDEIKNIIISLKSKNSNGYNEISSKLLKSCIDYISGLLITFVINQSLYEFFKKDVNFQN